MPYWRSPVFALPIGQPYPQQVSPPLERASSREARFAESTTQSLCSTSAITFVVPSVIFEMAWQSIYNTFEDNAFDYRGKPLEVGGALIMWQGGRWAEYVEVPF